jgi:hypothetical protein
MIVTPGAVYVFGMALGIAIVFVFARIVGA